MTITATIGAVQTHTSSGLNKVVLTDIYLNDEYFRDHSFINMDKRLRHLSIGDTFTGTCKTVEYPDIEDINKNKIGITAIRNIRRTK